MEKNEVTPEQELAILKEIFEDSFSVSMNMNDTFAYACADSEEIDSWDLKNLYPVIFKHGSVAFTAYAAIKRGYDPISPRIDYKFKAAKLEIEELLKTKDKYFLYDLRWALESERLKKDEDLRKRKTHFNIKNWFSFFR